MSESDDRPETTALTDRERQLLSALRYAWHEMNTIRARDGAPYHRGDRMAYCSEDWWDELTEKCASAIEIASGEPPEPWPFAWEKQQ